VPKLSFKPPSLLTSVFVAPTDGDGDRSVAGVSQPKVLSPLSQEQVDQLFALMHRVSLQFSVCIVVSVS